MSNSVAAEIAEINTRIEEASDPRDCIRLVRETMRLHEQRGESIPEDLQRLERALLAECNAASQGR